jgi:2-methylcitrate dehydratase PrpD
MPFLLAAIGVARKAGVQEFTPEFVRSPEVQSLMRRIRTEFDPDIEKKGYDKMRSRLEITLRRGGRIVREAENYRGSPDHPLSDEDVRRKFTDCVQGILPEPGRSRLMDDIFDLDAIENVDCLIQLAGGGPG